MRLAVCAIAFAGATATAHAADESPGRAVVVAADYKLDAMGVVRGGASRAGRRLDDLDISADLDLERAVGWSGASAHIDFSSTTGGAPGELAGALQGVDNIEVGAHRGRLYQAWVEAAFAGERGSLRAGFSDLSGEFGAIDSAGALINPSFGMAAEFGASGAAAYPSTALGLRLRVTPATDSYLLVAVANARAGAPGDRGGPDFSFDGGEIFVAEAGWAGRGKLAAGGWRLSNRRQDLSAVDVAGAPRGRRAWGLYALAEQPLAHLGPRTTTGFVRLGVADGRTSDFKGSWQAGLLLQPALTGRPESSLSFGVTQARLSPAARDAAMSAGQDLRKAETVLELTYSDQLTSRIRLQPDLQFVRRPGGDRTLKDALVVGLRLDIGL